MTLRIALTSVVLFCVVNSSYAQAPYQRETAEPPLAKDPNVPPPVVPPPASTPPTVPPPVLPPPVVPVGNPAPPSLLPPSVTAPETNGDIIPVAVQTQGSGPASPPIISLFIKTPQIVQPGKDVDFQIDVSNVSNVAAHKVEVLNPIPKGAAVVKADPVSTGDQSVLKWSLGTMPPLSKKSLTFTLRPSPDGSELVNVARVHFEYGQQTTTKIARPSLTLKRGAPTNVQQLDVLNLRLEVSNPGMSAVEQVEVIETLPPGLAHKYDGEPPTGSDSQRRVWKIGVIRPGEVKPITYLVETQNPGSFPMKAEAVAAGGARGEAIHTVTSTAPKFDVEVQAPPRQSNNQPSVVKITVRNSGPGVLRNVQVNDRLPPNCDFISASHNPVRDRDLVQWTVPTLNPNESRTMELQIRPNQPGRLVHAVTAVYRGIQKQADGATDFEQQPSLSWNVTTDTTAIEVGGTVRMTIVVENKGSAAATRVSPVVTVPDQFAFLEAVPRSIQQVGQQIQFEPMTVGPAEKKIYELSLKARSAAPSVLLPAELNADVFQSGPLRKQANMVITGERPRP